jgi:hypothetical protein
LATAFFFTGAGAYFKTTQLGGAYLNTFPQLGGAYFTTVPHLLAGAYFTMILQLGGAYLTTALQLGGAYFTNVLGGAYFTTGLQLGGEYFNNVLHLGFAVFFAAFFVAIIFHNLLYCFNLHFFCCFYPVAKKICKIQTC